jgi:hypothetical protein
MNLLKYIKVKLKEFVSIKNPPYYFNDINSSYTTKEYLNTALYFKNNKKILEKELAIKETQLKSRKYFVLALYSEYLKRLDNYQSIDTNNSTYINRYKDNYSCEIDQINIDYFSSFGNYVVDDEANIDYIRSNNWFKLFIEEKDKLHQSQSQSISCLNMIQHEHFIGESTILDNINIELSLNDIDLEFDETENQKGNIIIELSYNRAIKCNFCYDKECDCQLCNNTSMINLKTSYKIELDKEKLINFKKNNSETEGLHFIYKSLGDFNKNTMEYGDLCLKVSK